MLFEHGSKKPSDWVKMTATEAAVLGRISETGHLEQIITAIVTRRGVNEADAVGLLIREMRSLTMSGRISMGDVRGSSPALGPRLLEILDVPLEKKDRGLESTLRQMGVISHQVAAFGAKALPVEFPQQSLELVGQLELDLGEPSIEVVDPDGEYFAVADYLGAQLGPAFASVENYLSLSFSLQPDLKELKRLASILWPRSYQDLKKLVKSSLDEFYALSSILDWISVEKVRGEMPMYHLVEQNLVDWDELSLGRIDRVNFPVPIKPGATVAETVRNSGIRTLKKVEVVDWKFRAGDGLKGPIGISEIPLPSHILQMRLYQLGLSLAEVMSGEAKVWNPENFPAAKLVYLMAGKVVVIPSAMTPTLLVDFFREEIVQKMHRIDFRRMTREGSLALLEAVRRLLGKSNRRPRLATPAQEQHSLFSIEPAPSRLIHLVDEHRSWIGKFGMLEYLGENNYVLHLRKLRIAARSKSFDSGHRFDLDRGGFIRCPIHHETTPSFHVHIEQGYFHCFGCGIKGRIANESGRIIPSPRKDLNKDFARVILPSHVEDAYAILQDALTGAFSDSAAFRYLGEKRGLSRQKASKFGAGWGGVYSHFTGLAELWEAGFRLDELLELGVIRLSDTAKSSPLIDALRDFGLAESEIVRKRTLRSGREIEEYPYWSLSGKITFPLRTLIGSAVPVSGFYGRSVGLVRTSTHMIVTPREVVTRGIFNANGLANALADGGIERVFIAKGVMDALVLETMGRTPAVSLLGIQPLSSLKVIADLNPREVVFAFGFEKSVADAVAAFQAKLTEMGYKGRFDELSTKFVKDHPEISEMGFTDWASWWIGYGKTNR